MFISGKALWFRVTDIRSHPLACLLATRVINRTLLATRGTCFRSDTDIEQYVAYSICYSPWIHMCTYADADTGRVNPLCALLSK